MHDAYTCINTVIRIIKSYKYTWGLCTMYVYMPGQVPAYIDSKSIVYSLYKTFVVWLFLYIHSFIHYGYFYSAPSSPLLLRGVPDYSTDTVSEFHAEAHRQLQVKDLPKVSTWRLERESNPRPSG